VTGIYFKTGLVFGRGNTYDCFAAMLHYLMEIDDEQ
jgi:hypothetical protein